MQNVHVSGGGGYPPGGGPPGGGWGPPPGAPPGGGGYGPPPGAPPGGYGPPGGGPPPGSPPGGWGPPGGNPPGAPGGPPPGYGPPGAPPPGGPGGPPPGGPPGAPPPGYGPPGAPPGGGLPPGYVPPGAPPPGYGPPGYGPPGGPPGGAPPGGGYGPPGGAPPGYGPPGQQPPPPGGGHGGGFSPPGGGPPGWGAPPPGGGYPNAYAPPAAMGSVAGSWSPTDAIGFGWNALTKNFAGVALPIAVAIVVAVLPGQALAAVYAAMASVVADLVEPDFIGILGYLVQATSSLLGILIGSYMAGGIASFTLKVARGQPVGFGEVFSGGRYFGRMLVATIGLYIAVAIGFVLCIIPGYIVALGLSLYSFVVVDQGLPGIDALKKSWEMTNGHKVNIFVFGLLAILVVIAGLLACGIGVLLGSYPVLSIAFAYIYLKIKGEQPQQLAA